MVLTDVQCGRQCRCLGLRILVVENNAEDDQGTADFLRADGHRIETVADVPSALRAAQAEPPDVVLVDTAGVDGCEFAQEIRRLPLFRRPLVIAVGGPEQKPDRSHSLAAGIHLHLLKPIDKVFLSRVLRRYQSVVMPEEEQSCLAETEWVGN